MASTLIFLINQVILPGKETISFQTEVRDHAGNRTRGLAVNPRSIPLSISNRASIGGFVYFHSPPWILNFDLYICIPFTDMFP